MIISPRRPLATTYLDVELPTSKSIHIRAMLIEALSNGICSAPKQTNTDDAQLMQSLLRSTDTHLHTDNAGTVMRFLTAYTATLKGETHIISGSPRMHQRPIAPLVDALRQLGADIRYLGEEGYPPLEITGQTLIPNGPICIDAQNSSQYVSALMLIGSKLPGGITLSWVHTPTSFHYITLTAQMLTHSGAKTQFSFDTSTGQIRGVTVNEATWKPQSINLEKDWSAASYWYSAVALNPSLTVTFKGLSNNSSQGDAALPSIFTNFGVQSTWDKDILTINNQHTSTQHFTYDATNTPDLIPTLVATCCATNTHFTITGTNSLRIKESDRIAALQQELSKLGYILDDSKPNNTLSWHGDKTTLINKQLISTHNDHRIAMSMALMAFAVGDIEMKNTDVVSKSYPLFWQQITSLLTTL